MIVIKSLILFIVLILFPICLGGIITHFFDEKCGLFHLFVFGYLLEFGIFEVVGVPFIVLNVPFSVMTIVFVVWNVIGGGISVYLNREKIKSYKPNFINRVNEICTTDKLLIVAVITLILIQVMALVLFMHEDDDDIFYVGTAVTSIYENSMYKINPRTGLESETIEWKYVVSPFPLHLAVVSSLAHIHPTMVAHTILPIVFIPLCYATYYLISCKLFKDDFRSRLLFLIFLNVIYIFGNYSNRTNFTFLLFRIWQGKAVLANYAIPMIWLLWIMQEEKDTKLNYYLYVCAILAGLLTSSMGIIFPPMIIGVLSLIRWFKDRDTKKLIKTVSCCAVVILFAIPVFLSKVF